MSGGRFQRTKGRRAGRVVGPAAEGSGCGEAVALIHIHFSGDFDDSTVRFPFVFFGAGTQREKKEGKKERKALK